MVVSASPCVPQPGPSECLARMGLPALALLLATGLLPAQVSRRRRKVWEQRAGLSCEGSGICLALLPPSLLFLLWLPSAAARVLPQCPACVPDSLPALSAPVPSSTRPQSATGSAAGCLVSRGGPSGGANGRPACPSCSPGTAWLPASSLHRGRGVEGPLQEPAAVSPSPRERGRGRLGSGRVCSPQHCRSPAGLPAGALLPGGLRAGLLPQGRCPFPLHLGQRPLRPRPASRLEGPAPRAVPERAQRRAGVSGGAALTALRGLRGPWGRDRDEGVVWLLGPALALGRPDPRDLPASPSPAQLPSPAPAGGQFLGAEGPAHGMVSHRAGVPLSPVR